MAKMITIKECARLTGHKVSYFYNYYKGVFPYYIFNGRVLFDEAEVLDILHSQRIPTTAELQEQGGIGY